MILKKINYVSKLVLTLKSEEVVLFFIFFVKIEMSEVTKLKEEVEALKKELADTKKNDRTWADHVDEFVEEWYENNKDDVDIGQIKIAGRWKVDLIPDELEKRIYKKILKIVIIIIENIKFET